MDAIQAISLAQGHDIIISERTVVQGNVLHSKQNTDTCLEWWMGICQAFMMCPPTRCLKLIITFLPFSASSPSQFTGACKLAAFVDSSVSTQAHFPKMNVSSCDIFLLSFCPRLHVPHRIKERCFVHLGPSLVNPGGTIY